MQHFDWFATSDCSKNVKFSNTDPQLTVSKSLYLDWFILWFTERLLKDVGYHLSVFPENGRSL
jgi:hypothetical protein